MFNLITVLEIAEKRTRKFDSPSEQQTEKLKAKIENLYLL
jgi:hypothetical protein